MEPREGSSPPPRTLFSLTRYSGGVRLLALLGLLGGMGCGSVLSPTETATTDSIAATLRSLRQIARRRSIGFDVVAPAEFRREHLDVSTQDEPRARAAVWVAFGFTAPSIDPEVTTRVRAPQSTAAFDWSRRRIVAPGRPVFATRGAEAIWAHELTHALQDQLASPRFSSTNADERLAHAALLEGDATVMMFGYLAARNGQDALGAMRAVAERLSQMAAVDLPAWLGVTSAFSQAPALWRDQVRFQSLGGVPFVEAVLREGGVALLNRVLQRPPRSTEQILHPLRYFEGDEPIAVRDPAAPLGLAVRAVGTLGELGIASLLHQCPVGRSTLHAGEGWGGDRFVVVEREDQKLALLWSTVWDREADAAAFEALLRVQTTCWKEDAIETTHAIVRRGAKVALVRGLPRAEQPAILEGLFALPAPAQPARRPFWRIRGAGKLRGDEVIAHIHGGVFKSERYGIGATLPPGWRARAQRGPMLVLAGRPRSGSFPSVAASLTAIDEPPSEALFGLLQLNVQRLVGKRRTVIVAPLRSFELAGLTGYSQTFSIETPVRHYRYHAMGFCGGEATLLIHAEWGPSDDLIEIGEWEKSITVAAGAAGCEKTPEYEHSDADGRDPGEPGPGQTRHHRPEDRN